MKGRCFKTKEFIKMNLTSLFQWLHIYAKILSPAREEIIWNKISFVTFSEEKNFNLRATLLNDNFQVLRNRWDTVSISFFFKFAFIFQLPSISLFTVLHPFLIFKSPGTFYSLSLANCLSRNLSQNKPNKSHWPNNSWFASVI